MDRRIAHCKASAPARKRWACRSQQNNCTRSCTRGRRLRSWTGHFVDRRRRFRRPRVLSGSRRRAGRGRRHLRRLRGSRRPNRPRAGGPLKKGTMTCVRASGPPHGAWTSGARTGKSQCSKHTPGEGFAVGRVPGQPYESLRCARKHGSPTESVGGGVNLISAAGEPHPAPEGADYPPPPPLKGGFPTILMSNRALWLIETSPGEV